MRGRLGDASQCVVFEILFVRYCNLARSVERAVRVVPRSWWKCVVQKCAAFCSAASSAVRVYALQIVVSGRRGRAHTWKEIQTQEPVL